MSSVDNRIVNMQFNNKDFQTGAADSVKSLEELEQTIADLGGTDSLSDLSSSVDEAASRFGALQIAGVAALATIASQVTSTALSIGRDLVGSVTGAVLGSGLDRAKAIEQAKFQFRGLGLDVKEVMQNATDAVTDTAFGLNEAATVATQFGGSGVKAGEDMTTALRAISGIAAQTGRSYSEIGQVMTGIAGVGRLTSQDLIQFGVRGLDVTGALAESMGITQQEVRELVSEGEIGFKQFAKVMDDAFGENAAKSNRTFTGSLANMKAALSRIGADFFTPQLKVFRDVFNSLGTAFDHVRRGLKPTSEAFGELSQNVANGVIGFIDGFHEMKVIRPILEGIKNVLAPLGALFKAFGDAWKEAFPSTGENTSLWIIDLAKGFKELTEPLRGLAENVIPKITPLIAILFTTIKAGVSIVAALASGIGNLASKFVDIGENIVGGILSGLNATDIQNAITEFANNIVTWIKSALGINSPAEALIPVGTAIVQGIGEGIKAAIGFVLDVIGTIGGAIIDGFKQMFGSMDALDWSALINAALTGGLIFALYKFARTLTGFIEGLGETLGALTNPFGKLTEALGNMTDSVKTPILLQIAIAVGTLTAALIALAFLPQDKLIQGLGALAGVLALVGGSTLALSKIDSGDIIQVAAALVLISASMVVLAGAVAAFGAIPFENLKQGLGGGR